MENKGPYYLTTAIAYTSGKPHIGNVYEIVLADAIARYKRQVGYDVRFQTGTDEHGQKVEEKAKAAGISPKAFVDQVSSEIKEQQIHIMKSKYKRFLRNCMNKVIFIRDIMMDCIVKSVKRSIHLAKLQKRVSAQFVVAN